MAQKTISSEHLSKTLVSLIAIVLCFVLLLIFIWLWYDVKIKTLDKELQTPASDQPLKPS